MIKLGETGIGKMFLGDTEIAKAYLGESLVYDAGGSPTPPGPVLPYDAQVEYLQSDGSQYIDTGIVGDLNTELALKVSMAAIPKGVCGSRGDNTNSMNVYAASSGTQRFGNKSTLVSWSANTDYTITFNKTAFVRNGTTSSIGATAAFTTDSNIFIFGNDREHCSCKLYYFQISKNGELVLDLIPVRVGQAGYMYDRVSGQLFGNDGTGNFTLGNDVTT